MSKLSSDELQGLHDLIPKKYNLPKTNDNITEYIYDTKYISGEALEVFTTFTDRNQYLIKSGTGAGGTTAMLNQTKHNVIIITPNRSQVRNKQSKNKDKKNLFIYGQSQGKSNNWQEVHSAMTTGTGIVAMTVVDSFFHLKDTNPELYDYFKDCHLIIDECHTTIKDSFRSMMEILYNEVQTWRVSIKFSTATPQPRYLDMIPTMNVELIRVVSKDKVNQIVSFTENKKAVMEFIQTEIFYDRDVLVFTNDAKIYNTLCATFGGNGGDSIDNIVHTSTGKSLRNTINKFEEESYKFKSTDILTKLYSYEDGDIKSLEYAIEQPHKRLFICSKAYFAGWDFPRKCSIAVISDQSNTNLNLDWLDAVQAIGRGRKGYHNILFANLPPLQGSDGILKQRTGIDCTPYLPSITEQQLSNHLLNIGNGTEFKSVVKRLNCYNEYYTLNQEAREEKFAEYGYYLQPYIPNNSKFDWEKFKFTDFIQNLMTYSEETLLDVIKKEGTYELRNEIYIDGDKHAIGTISPELVLLYYIAYILVKYRPMNLINRINNDVNRKLKTKEFSSDVREFLLQFLDGDFHNLYYDYNQFNGDFIEDENPKPTENMVYEYLLLYAGCGYDEENYNYDILRQIRISVVMGDRIKMVDLITNPNRITLASDRIITRLKKKHSSKEDEKEMDNIILTDEERIYVRTTVRRNFEWLDDWYKERETAKLFNAVTKKALLKKIRRASLFFFTRAMGSYKPKEIDSRTYSPLSSLSKNLRIALPIKFICFDIQRANPTIICNLLKIPNNVIDYDKIARIFSKGIGEGKVFFNATLNDHKLGFDAAKRIYIKCGFEIHDAIQLAKWTSGVEKGAMFRRMIAAEKEMIEMFIDKAIAKYPTMLTRDMFYRLHDAVVIPQFLLLDCNLQTEFGDTIFVKTEFNGNYNWGF